MNPPSLRTTGSPDVATLNPPEDTELSELLARACRRYLQGGALLIKQAPRISLSYIQVANVPTTATPLNHLIDANSDSRIVPRSAYLVTMVGENQSFRYLMDGQKPTQNYGMIVAPGQYIDAGMQDLRSVQICAVLAGCTLNVELYEVGV